MYGWFLFLTICRHAIKAKIKLLLLGIASRFIEIPPTDLLAKNKNPFFFIRDFSFFTNFLFKL